MLPHGSYAVFADYHRTRKLICRGHAVDGLFVSYSVLVIIVTCGCLSLRECCKLSAVLPSERHSVAVRKSVSYSVVSYSEDLAARIVGDTSHAVEPNIIGIKEQIFPCLADVFAAAVTVSVSVAVRVGVTGQHIERIICISRNLRSVLRDGFYVSEVVISISICFVDG